MKKYSPFLLLLLLLSFTSCKDQDKVDYDLILQYLDDNNLNADSTPSGIYYIINDSGAGGHPNVNSLVTVYYKGYLLDGTVFDETDRNTDPVSFYLFQTILGWQESIPLLQAGGNGTFFIPSSLGYGNKRTGSIPKNSVLVFEVELVEFQ